MDMDEYGSILDMIEDDDGHFVFSNYGQEEAVQTEAAGSPTYRLEFDAPATVAVASFGVGLFIGAVLRRRGQRGW